MKRSLLLARSATLLIILAACSGPPRKPAIRASDYQGIIRVACVGDSITFGAGVEDRERNCYPVVLSKFLGPRFDVRNFGVNGATLLRKGDKPYWTLPEFERLDDFNPQVIILALGTNDSKPQNWNHGAEFADDLRALLGHFSAYPSHPKIWICLPPPVYESRWGIEEATLVGQIAPVIRQVAGESNIPTIDLHLALGNRPEFFPDGVHPDARGAGMLAITVYTALKGR